MQEDNKFKKRIFKSKIRDKIQINELLVQIVTTFNEEPLKSGIFSFNF